MTELLLRIFLKDHKDPEAPGTRSAVGKLSGAVGIVCNLLLFAMKLVAGTIAGSVAITADAMNNLSDASSSIVTLAGFKLAERPADADHPYGHARFEYLSGLAVSALIILIGFELGVSSVKKILHPEPTDFTLLTAVILLVSIAVKLWMAAFNRGLGKKIRSTALTATAMDSRNDVIATATVLVASVFAHFTHIEVDGYVGAAVAAFILISGAGLAKDTISPLLGEAADPELQHAVVNEIKNCPSVLGIHDLMVHDYGPGQRFASVHVEMDAREDPLLCHDLIDDIERACKEKHNVHLVIHYDPVVTDDEEINHMHTEVAEILTSLDDRLTIHDFRMVRGPGHNNLIFDVSIPFECKGKGPIIKKELDAAIAAREEKTYYTVITFDQAEC